MIMREHKIDIIIPCFNYGGFLDECLGLVTAQTRGDFQVLVMDNASTDNTSIVAQRWMESDRRIRYHRNEQNIGAVANFRLGYALTSADYVVILPADDMWRPRFLEVTCGALDAYPECAYAYTAWHTGGKDPHEADQPMHSTPHENGGIVEDMPYLVIQNHIPLSFSVFRRSACERVGGPYPVDLPMLGDLYLWMRLASVGYGYFAQENLGRLRLHGGNESGELYYSGRSANDHLHILDLVFQEKGWPLPVRLLAKARQYQLLTGKSLVEIIDSFSSDTTPKLIRDYVDDAQDGLIRAAAMCIRAWGGKSIGMVDVASDADELDNRSAMQDSERVKRNSRSVNFWQATYQQWLSARHKTIEELQANEPDTFSEGPTFHLVIRQLTANTEGLADTLDNLKYQLYGNWYLDIVSPLPAPDGIEDVDCVGWHSCPHENAADLVEQLVQARQLDWIAQLPPGAVIDPLCLQRIAREIDDNPDILAFFVDDDVFDDKGVRQHPRFKPGVNREWLLSSDLAGPLFIRRDSWHASGGASMSHESPWFDQLVRIARKFGWNRLAHVPDVLISYREAFPTQRDACLESLMRHLPSGGSGHEFVALTDRSWCIRRPLHTEPLVSIIVLSRGQSDMLARCISSVLGRTAYPSVEIILSITDTGSDPDLAAWLADLESRFGTPIRVVMTAADGNQATRCNMGAAAASGTLLAFVQEEVAILQDRWLHELVQTMVDERVGAVAPRIVNPAGKKVHNAGNVLGLLGMAGTPYQDDAELEDTGYLDYLWVCRETGALSVTCLLVRADAYLGVGGMDEAELGGWLADADLCQKMRAEGLRLLFQPLAAVSCRTDSMALAPTGAMRAKHTLEKGRAESSFASRWLQPGTRDPFWNPNLSLTQSKPVLQTDYRCQWLVQPDRDLPRLLARGVTNAQADFRILDPLRVLCRAGRASACIWPQIEGRPEPTPSDLARLAPDSVIVQNYISDACLATLERWQKLAAHRPFVVFALDDLITDLDPNNPFRKSLYANGRARLRFALQRCDRMVVSTEYLAEVYRHFIDDIRIVPNRLDPEIWLPLTNRRRAGDRPRIGWAGGITHQDDLLVLQEVIERTRGEADWIFFGMCPDEIRPLLAEYHDLVRFADYPAKLASLCLDIAVAPLADTPFNHGKSNLRLLEYGVLGIPVVCSDITPYRNSPACRVPNDPDRWIEALRARIQYSDARESEGRTLQRWVRQNFLLTAQQDEWLDAHLPS